MNQRPIKCRKIDATYANCEIDGKEVKCVTKPNKKALACSKDGQGNYVCNSIDFFCDVVQPSKEEEQTSWFGIWKTSAPNI